MFVNVCNCIISSIFWLHLTHFSYHNSAFCSRCVSANLCVIYLSCKTQASHFRNCCFIFESHEINIKNAHWKCLRFVTCKTHSIISKVQQQNINRSYSDTDVTVKFKVMSITFIHLVTSKLILVCITNGFHQMAY